MAFSLAGHVGYYVDGGSGSASNESLLTSATERQTGHYKPAWMILSGESGLIAVSSKRRALQLRLPGHEIQACGHGYHPC